MSSWPIKTCVDKLAAAQQPSPEKNAAGVLKLEVDRLAKQLCCFCNGWGHSGHDCPTNRKVGWLCAGQSVATRIVVEARKESRKKHPMAGTTGFSSLSAVGATPGRKRKR